MTTKKNKNYNVKNGITITDSISLTINSKYWINPKLLLILTALAGVLGFSFSFLTLFNFQYHTIPIFAAILLMFIICSVIFMFPSKAKLLLIPIYIFVGYESYKFKTSLAYGYADFINTIASDIEVTSKNHDYYSIPSNIDTSECLTIFLILLFVVITSIICYNTIVKPRFIFAFSSTFPFIETGLYFGLAPAHLPFFVLIAYWVAVFAMRVAGNQFHSTSGQPVFVRKKNIFVSSGNLKNNVIESIGIIILISVFSVFIISAAVLNVISFKRSDKINQTRHDLKTAISEMSLEKIIDSFSENINNVPITDKSRLGNVNSISFDNKTDLSVLFSDTIDSNLYLKGFTGSEYKNNSWYVFSEDFFKKNKDLIDTFRQNECYPQNFNSINSRALTTIMPEQVKRHHIIVKSSFKSNNYLFAPYGVIMNNMFSSDDAFLKADNMNEYSYSFYDTPDSNKEFNLISDNINIFSQNNIFNQTETVYRNFVYTNYLSLPDNDGIKYLSENFPQIPHYDGSNISEISYAIKNLLNNSAEYSLKPGRTPDGTDLAYYLIVENHKGYCSHFATAAVVLARIAGVPARYAEGYVIIPDDFKSAERTESYYKINITDSRAHAWAEFYIDGYGWLPFEFTPGYSNGIISAETQSPEQSDNTTEVTEDKPTGITESQPQSQAYVSTQTDVSTVTQKTSASSYISGSSPKNTPSDNENKILSPAIIALRIILFLIITFITIITIIFIRHIIKIKKLTLGFSTKSINKNITNVYQYTLLLLESIGISDSNMLPFDFAEYAEENIEGFAEKGQITELIRIALKSSYSDEIITVEELRTAVATADNIAKNIYNSKSRTGKIYFKFILNLIR